MSDYYVKDDNDKNAYYPPDKDGYFNLKQGKEYHITLTTTEGKGGNWWSKAFYYYVADSEKKDVIVDMYRIDKYFNISVGAYPSEGIHYYWYDCNERCEGKLTDYYDNGSIRLKGKFENGYPIGKLYFYKEDGTLDYIEKYSRIKTGSKYRQLYRKEDGTWGYYGTSKFLRTIKK